MSALLAKSAQPERQIYIISQTAPFYNATICEAISLQLNTRCSQLFPPINMEHLTSADCLLLDLKTLSGQHILQIVRQCIKQEGKLIPVVLLNSRQSSRHEQYTNYQCVLGTTEENCGTRQIARAVAAVLAGELWIPRRILNAAYRRQQQRHVNLPNTAQLSNLPTLTQREQQIMTGLRNADSNLEIAKTLGIKENTVKAHLYNLYRKLGVKSRLEALKCVKEQGLYNHFD